jgi:hypothetical protein
LKWETIIAYQAGRDLLLIFALASGVGVYEQQITQPSSKHVLKIGASCLLLSRPSFPMLRSQEVPETTRKLEFSARSGQLSLFKSRIPTGKGLLVF